MFLLGNNDSAGRSSVLSSTSPHSAGIMSRRSAIEQIVIEEKTVCDAVLKLVNAREKGEEARITCTATPHHTTYAVSWSCKWSKTNSSPSTKWHHWWLASAICIFLLHWLGAARLLYYWMLSRTPYVLADRVYCRTAACSGDLHCPLSLIYVTPCRVVWIARYLQVIWWRDWLDLYTRCVIPAVGPWFSLPNSLLLCCVWHFL